ncbi:MAG: HAD-IA family hydrolase [Chlamydiia bacterium]|nr:HAD-IA family hydrolase [Chlamydiia bacterium]
MARLIRQYGELYERGAVSSETLHKEMEKAASLPLPFQKFLHAMSDIFQPKQPAIDIALALKKKGHPLFVLSNTCEAHFLYLYNHFDFFKLFDGFVLSYEVQARKPEEKIFHKALEIASCSASDCFYTDDVLDYVESAKTFGMDAEQFTTPSNLITHLSHRGFL